MSDRKRFRLFAKIMTYCVIGKEKRKEKRIQLEEFLHKLFHTEYYRCKQIFEQSYQENRQIGLDKYHLISLGNNCFGRMTFSYWGLKPRKADGEKTMPFDISIHPLKTVNDLLENHFQGYFDDIEFDEQKGYWINPQLNIAFVHDHENDKTAFIEKYQNRIKALDAVLQDNVPCVFFAYQDGAVKGEEINKLYTILKQLCAHKPFKLIYMVFNAPLPENIDADIATYRADFPVGYRHMDKYSKYTQNGLTFEKNVVDYTKQQIIALLGANKKASD